MKYATLIVTIMLISASMAGAEEDNRKTNYFTNAWSANGFDHTIALLIYNVNVLNTLYLVEDQGDDHLQSAINSLGTLVDITVANIPLEKISKLQGEQKLMFDGAIIKISELRKEHPFVIQNEKIVNKAKEVIKLGLANCTLGVPANSRKIK